MARKAANQQLAQRLALWAAGNMLPEAYVLRPYMDAFRKGIMAAVVGGFMIALGASVALLAVFTLLVDAGLGETAAMGLVGGIAVLLALLAYSSCMRSFERASQVKYSLKLFPHTSASSGDVLLESGRAIVSGFMEGLKAKPAEAEAEVDLAVAHFNREMERVVKEIEALEKAAMKEDEAKARARARYDETVHELYPGGKPPHGHI